MRGSGRGRGGKVSRTVLAVAVAVLALVLVIFLISRPGGQTSVAENAAGTVFSPIQRAFTNATNWAVNLIEHRRNYQELSEEYAALRRDNDSLKLEIASLEEEEEENKRLRSLLGAYDRYDSLDPLYAKVIARAPGPWFDSFSINAGTSSGVAVNMAVVTGDGLVGRVYEVGYNWAKVLSVIDSRSAVSCLIQRTRDNGVLRGVTTTANDTASCYVYYLPASSDAAVGDTVITSGVDMIYPKGIPVGQVSAVSRAKDAAESYVVVTPHADFAHIEEVLVLRVQNETDTDETLPSLPTPTPRPTKEPTELSLPTASPEPTTVPEGDDDIWYYPTIAPTAPADPADMQDMEQTWAEGVQQ